MLIIEYIVKVFSNDFMYNVVTREDGGYRMNITEQYNNAKERYAELGIDTDKALERLKKISLSLHCWQTDDVGGFETPDAELSGGGIQVTGNYPGKAGTASEIWHIGCGFPQGVSVVGLCTYFDYFC